MHRASRDSLRMAIMLGAMAMGAVLELPVRGDEWSGPLEGWADAKRDFQAVGDGKADDTVALQKALDALRDEKGLTRTVYLPAGMYRITRTLTLPRKGGREAIGLNIQGESPDMTIVVWDGPADGVMFDYGAWYSKLGRITFDGRGKAKTAVRHGPEFVTANEMADMMFRDVGFGIEAGDPARAGIAETSVQRCRFLRCSKAGVSIQNFNSLDWWMWYCLFEDCRVGATNSYGAGNFHVYKSVFRRSIEADVTIGNTGYFSFRHNTSVFLGVCFTQVGGDEGVPALVVQGGDPQTKVLALGCHGSGEYFANQSSSARAARLDSVQYTPGGGAKPIADVGQGDEAFLTEMLAQTRELLLADGENVATGLTDVRLHHVFVRNPMIGISLTPGQ